MDDWKVPLLCFGSAHGATAGGMGLLKYAQLSRQHCPNRTAGRSTIWLHPAIPLHFVFDAPAPEKLNLEWLERLMHSANSNGGIQLIEESHATG